MLRVRVVIVALAVSAACRAPAGDAHAPPGADPSTATEGAPADARGDEAGQAGDPWQPPGDPSGADPGAAADPGATPGDVVSGDPLPGDPGLPHLACDLETQTAVQNVSVGVLHTYIGYGDPLAVVDVREPSETASGVIAGALLYPWNTGVLQAQYASLPTDRPLFVICGSGGRSAGASTFIANHGYNSVFNVLSGMNAWKNAGYPTLTP